MAKSEFVFSCILLYNLNNHDILMKRGDPMRKGISQEGLKLIACITMLIDHIGYEIIYPLYAQSAVIYKPDQLYNVYLVCRCIGRIAFPIFAFLLVEGIHHTRNRKKYMLRLILGAVLAEVPYNLMVSGKVFWLQQSVMVTLLLGFGAMICMEKCSALVWKPVAVIPFAVLAEAIMADYGWAGVVLIALFDLSREMYSPNLVRFGGMIVLFHYMSSHILWFGNFSLPIQVLGVLSLLFIANYDGRKLTGRKTVQWAFYLFYPVHLLILWGIGNVLSEILSSGVGISV